ncbi:MAG TPA: GntR family transcriptional regulator [Phenylobacterium sp.]|nr:GntR family transcriptional regulator [Phenylobacterium sp.]
MAADRAEPFQVALTALREQLRDAAFLPGERIAASELAGRLRLSATPVREALSQLCGEGLLEDRRGQGWFVRALSGVDIADLYRLSLAVQTIAHDPRRTPPRRAPDAETTTPAPDAADPVQAVERLFADWTAHAGGRTLYAVHQSLQAKLEPVRRAEPLVFADLADEADRLRALGSPTPAGLRLAEIRRFYARRISVADRLASLIYPSRTGP